MRYTRKNKDGLHMAHHTYMNSSGHIIELVGVIHAAEKSFWGALNKYFKHSSNTVHYEGVKHDDKNYTAEEKAHVEQIKQIASVSSLFAQATGLTFQKDSEHGLHYKEDWKHYDVDVVSLGSDLTLSEKETLLSGVNDYKKLMKKDPQGFKKVAFWYLSNPFFFDVARKIAVFSESSRAALKFMNSALDDRNAFAISHALAEKQNVSLIWGAAHLPGMGKILKRSGYSLVSEKWHLAISAKTMNSN